jgi:hypothetical protein
VFREGTRGGSMMLLAFGRMHSLFFCHSEAVQNGEEKEVGVGKCERKKELKWE